MPEAAEGEAKRILITVIPSQLKQVLERLCSPWGFGRLPKPMGVPFVWGGTGVGKTQIIGQMARQWLMRLCALHLPQYMPTDLKGFPIKDADGRILWVASSYLPQQHIVEGLDAGKAHEIVFKFFHAKSLLVRVLDESEEVENVYHEFEAKEVVRIGDLVLGEDINEINAKVKVVNVRSKVTVDLSKAPKGRTYTVVVEDRAVLFLDELSAASDETGKAALQLVLDRRLNDYVVPSGTPILAAGNHEKHGAHIKKMSAALANRMCHIRLVHDLNDWIEYGQQVGIHPAVLSFPKTAPFGQGMDYLWNYDPSKMKEGDMGMPSPRTLEALSRQIHDGIDLDLLKVLVAGFIGSSYVHVFIAHWTDVMTLPSIDDILDGKATTLDKKHQHVGIQHTIAIMLTRGLKQRYDALVTDPSAKWDAQAPQWKKSVINFCTFTQANMKPDVVILASSALSVVHNINSVSFLARGEPAVESWVKRFLPFNRRIKRGSAMHS